MKPLFKRVVIAGVGLIGGSLALAGRKAGLFGSVVGLSRKPETIQKAVQLGIADEGYVSIEEAARGADLFFAATPVESISSLCIEAARVVNDGCVITDGGSVKGKIVKELDSSLPARVRFVGGHPVAGTEKSGPEAAFADLYKGKYTILTPTEKTDKEALGLVRMMWKEVGSEVVSMDPEKHDEALAVISHLPHFAAYALVGTLIETDTDGAMRRFIAGGFKDTTRIAASDPRMWRDIFSMNKEKTLESIRAFESNISRLRRLMEQGDFDGLEEALREIRAARIEMENG